VQVRGGFGPYGRSPHAPFLRGLPVRRKNAAQSTIKGEESESESESIRIEESIKKPRFRRAFFYKLGTPKGGGDGIKIGLY